MVKKSLCLMNWVLVLVLSLFVTLPAFAGEECAAVYGSHSAPYYALINRIFSRGIFEPIAPQ